MMKRFISLILCLLMLITVTGCANDHGHDHDPSTPSAGDIQTTPSAQNAKGSVFIGTWNVTAQVSTLQKLVFHEDGTIQATTRNSVLGGVFFDDGSKLSLYISQRSLAGAYTVDGDTITVKTANDVLVLKKAK